MKFNYLIFVLCLMAFVDSNSQTIIPLWQDSVPGNKMHQVEEIREISPWGGAKVLSGVSHPELWAFECQQKGKRPAIIICPGGGYAKEAYEHEGTQVAEWLNTLGIHAFVLKYRLPDEQICKEPTYAPLKDAQRAIQIIKGLETEINIDINKVGIMGFSAGGHLAASASNFFNQSLINNASLENIIPDFSILIYPVISMTDSLTHKGSREALLGKNASAELIDYFSIEKQVSENTPPTFILHALDDEAVSVKNTKVYVEALKEISIPVEMVLLESGGHGFGFRSDSPAFVWTDHLEKWLRDNALLNESNE